VTVSTIAPMTGPYDHLKVALSVLLTVAGSYPALNVTGRLHSPTILLIFICMNCWGPTPTPAVHRQEVVC